MRDERMRKEKEGENMEGRIKEELRMRKTMTKCRKKREMEIKNK